jgi:hypothetical protein
MPPRAGRGVEVFLFDRGARRGGWSASRPGRFTPGKDPVPIVQEAGWAPGPVWTCAKNLAPPGFDPRTVQPGVKPFGTIEKLDWENLPLLHIF